MSFHTYRNINKENQDEKEVVLPANVCDGIELIGDFRNSRRDNRVVQSNQKHSETQRCQNYSELQTVRIFDIFFF